MGRSVSWAGDAVQPGRIQDEFIWDPAAFFSLSFTFLFTIGQIRILAFDLGRAEICSLSKKAWSSARSSELLPPQQVRSRTYQPPYKVHVVQE